MSMEHSISPLTEAHVDVLVRENDRIATFARFLPAEMHASFYELLLDLTEEAREMGEGAALSGTTYDTEEEIMKRLGGYLAGYVNAVNDLSGPINAAALAEIYVEGVQAGLITNRGEL